MSEKLFSSILCPVRVSLSSLLSLALFSQTLFITSSFYLIVLPSFLPSFLPDLHALNIVSALFFLSIFCIFSPLCSTAFSPPVHRTVITVMSQSTPHQGRQESTVTLRLPKIRKYKTVLDGALYTSYCYSHVDIYIYLFCSQRMALPSAVLSDMSSKH